MATASTMSVTSAPTHGAQGAGRIYVYSTGSGRLLWTRRRCPGDQLGTGVEAAGDTDRDGIPDVIASGPAGRGVASSTRAVTGGCCTSFHAPRGEETLRQPRVRASATQTVTAAQTSSSAPRQGARPDAGHAYVYSGEDGALLLTLSGERDGDQFGSTVAGYAGAQASGTWWWARRAPGRSITAACTSTRARDHKLRSPSTPMPPAGRSAPCSSRCPGPRRRRRTRRLRLGLGQRRPGPVHRTHLRPLGTQREDGCSRSPASTQATGSAPARRGGRCRRRRPRRPHRGGVAVRSRSRSRPGAPTSIRPRRPVLRTYTDRVARRHARLRRGGARRRGRRWHERTCCLPPPGAARTVSLGTRVRGLERHCAARVTRRAARVTATRPVALLSGVNGRAVA